MRRLRAMVLVLLLVICAGSFWQAQRSRISGPDPVPAAPELVPQQAPEAGGTVHLTVLNGTRHSGLARRASRVLPALGCVVLALDDAPHDTFAATLLINRRLDEARARRLAAALGVPQLREWDPRAAEDAVLVLGADAPRLLAALGESP